MGGSNNPPKDAANVPCDDEFVVASPLLRASAAARHDYSRLIYADPNQKKNVLLLPDSTYTIFTPWLCTCQHSKMTNLQQL